MRIAIRIALGVTVGLAVGACNAGARGTMGVQAFQARSSAAELDLSGIQGTADVSARWTSVWAGAAFERSSYTYEVAASIGFRRTAFDSLMGNLTTLDPERTSGVFDSYSASVMVPMTSTEVLRVGAYGRAAATGLSRLLGSTSSKYGLEGGVELSFRQEESEEESEKATPYLRLGVLIEPSVINLDESGGFNDPQGDTTFIGLAASLGLRIGE